MTISNSTSEFPPEDSENPSTFQTNIKLKGKEKQTEQEKRKEKESPINQGVKISQKRNIGYSDMCQFLLNQTITGAMLQFFTDYVGLNNNAIYGTALLIFGFWDAINNTIFAYFSDKATPHPQKGKRKRFIVWGLPIMFLGFTLLVLTPRSWTDMRKFAMILGTMFVFDTGLALFQVNLEALIITITKNPDERASISALRSVITMLPGAAAGIVPTFLFTSGFSYEAILAYLLLIGLLSFGISFLAARKLKEPFDLYEIEIYEAQKRNKEKAERVEKGEKAERAEIVLEEEDFNEDTVLIEYGFWEVIKETFSKKSFIIFTAFSFFAGLAISSYYSDIVYLMKWNFRIEGIPAIFVTGLGGLLINGFYYIWKKLRRKIGTVKALYIGMPLIAVGNLILYLFNNYWSFLSGYWVACLGYSAFWILRGILIADIADQDYMENKINRQALFGAVLAIITTLSARFYTFIFTLALDAIGFDGTATTQSPETLAGLKFIATFFRIIFSLLAVGILYFYPLKGKAYEKHRQEFELFLEEENDKLEKTKKEKELHDVQMANYSQKKENKKK